MGVGTSSLGRPMRMHGSHARAAVRERHALLQRLRPLGEPQHHELQARGVLGYAYDRIRKCTSTCARRTRICI